MEEPDRLQYMGLHRVRHDLATKQQTTTHVPRTKIAAEDPKLLDIRIE